MDRACVAICLLSLAFCSTGLAQADPRLDKHRDPLPKHAVARFGSTRFKHSEAALGLTWAPKGSVLVSGGWDGIRVWEGKTGKLIRSLVMDRGQVCFAVAFSPDGSKFATGHSGGVVRLWAYPSFESLLEVAAHYGTGVMGVAFAPNGELFASTGEDGDVCVWKVGEQVPAHRLDIDREGAGGVSFSHDSKRLAADGKTDVFVWDVETGAEIVRIENAHGLSANSVLFMPDGSLLSGGRAMKLSWVNGKRVGVGESQVFHWNASTGQRIHSYAPKPPDTGPAVLALSANGKVLATAHYPRIRLWDLASREQMRDWPLAYSPRSLTFSADGKRLATNSRINDLAIFDTATGERINKPNGHVESITQIALSNDDKLAATVSRDGVLIVTEIASGKRIAKLDPEGNADRTNAVAFSQKGHILFYGGGDLLSSGFLSAFDVTAGKNLWSLDLKQHVDAISNPVDQRIAIAMGGYALGVGRGKSPGSTLSLRDIRDGQELISTKSRALVMGIPRFDGKSLSAFDRGGVVTWSLQQDDKLNSVEYGGHQATNKRPPTFHSVAFSANGKHAASSSLYDPAIIIRKADDGSVLRKIEISDSSSNMLAYSSDGKLIAVASFNYVDARKSPQIRIYNVNTGQSVARFLPGHSGTRSLSFTHDGQRLISGHADGTALVWDTSKLAQ